ncbi:MAG TPA: M1 family metallopeptidase [Fimbriimonadaceae bacterium]|nr:M1 family metallopeptidase [Fimbriimonadaceae bacterium]
MLPLLPNLVLTVLASQPAPDLHDSYDVDTYRLDLTVNPETKTLSGVGTTVAKITREADTFELDLLDGRTVEGVHWVKAPVTPTSSLAGEALKFTRSGDHIFVRLPRKLEPGEEARVAVAYRYKPPDRAETGIFFHETPDGKPWVQTDCQVLGADSWWPCKNDNEHPEDKSAHYFVNATVPSGLTAVSNGVLASKETKGPWTTFRWRHDYPCENYAICLDVAPYIEIQDSITIPGMAKPVPASYFMLAQDVPKAKLQFQDAPGMLRAYSEAFGPWPYPNERFKLVETDFWGEEHSTAVSYGNTFPKWASVHGEKDRYGGMNRMFDYILIHECAHEWWGNAVSAKDWGHLWIHEGFATYAEAVYLEKTEGRDKADEWLEGMKGGIPKQFREFRGEHALPSQAFDNGVYYKGAWILNTLRTYIDNDEEWWKALREFNLRFRYKCATTEDFEKVLEEVTGRSWSQFFQEWFYGDSQPAVTGSVSLKDGSIVVDVDNPAQNGVAFHVPLDLQWTAGGTAMKKRIWLDPGSNKASFEAGAEASGLSIVGLKRMLGSFRIEVNPG